MEKNSIVLVKEISGKYSIHQRYLKIRTPVEDRMRVFEIVLNLIEEKSICAEDVVTILDSVMRSRLPNLPQDFRSECSLADEEISLLENIRNIRNDNKNLIDLNNMRDLPKCTWGEDEDSNFVCNIYYNERDDEGEETGEKRCSGLIYSKNVAYKWLFENADKEKIDVMDVVKLQKQIKESDLKDFEEFYVVEFKKNPDLSYELIAKN